MTKSVLKEIDKLENDGKRYSCPIDTSKIEKIKDYYGDYARWLVNDKGHQTHKN